MIIIEISRKEKVFLRDPYDPESWIDATKCLWKVLLNMDMGNALLDVEGIIWVRNIISAVFKVKMHYCSFIGYGKVAIWCTKTKRDHSKASDHSIIVAHQASGSFPLNKKPSYPFPVTGLVVAMNETMTI